MSRLAGGLLLVFSAGLAAEAAIHAEPPGDGRETAGVTAGSRGLDGEAGARPARARIWADDHVMVSVDAVIDLAALAAERGSRILRAAGPGGYAALAVPADRDPARFVAELNNDARVRDAARVGIVRAASPGGRAATLGRRDRWHMIASNAPREAGGRGIVVAMLDTGVAYEDRVERGARWCRAPALHGVRFVAPWDFINDDPHPNDDHQHGTHLTSLVAAGGAYPGIAPDVTIMPVKVLDRENVGTELALVDGIRHAVQNGADVVNMSLSFGRGYVPSKALVDALEEAHAAGVVLVAAAGNDGGDYVAQPAANPLVFAVGAIRPEGPDTYGPAPYSNASPRVDLLAPGGSVDQDRDEDGLLDGVIGETIALQDPSRTGYWLYAGTSQATALVSGAAARLLAAGHSPEDVRVLLQASATPERYIARPWLDGRGRGRLDVTGALALAESETAPRARDLAVGLLAWLAPEAGSGVYPMARITVLDERRRPVPDALVVGAFSGEDDVPYRCRTGADGACVARGPASAGERAAWTVTADDVVLGDAAHHPRVALYATEGLQALVAAIDADPEIAGAVPAWRWRAQVHPALGPVADGLLVGNLGRSRATSPQVVIARPGALGSPGAIASGELVVGGGGEASSKVEVRPRAAPLCDAGPLAWEVVHFAAADVTAMVIDATGLGTTPLGVTAPAVLGGLETVSTPGASTGASAPRVETWAREPIVLSRPDGGSCDPAFARTPLGRVLARGGWTARGGEPAATALFANGSNERLHIHLSGSAAPP